MNPEAIAELSAKEIKALVEKTPEESYPALAAVLAQDGRSTVQNLAAQVTRRWEREERLRLKTAEMKAIELACYDEGYQYICGIDEVGRGPLAGPVVCAAVIMPRDSAIPGVDDSKKLSAKKREALNEKILEEALAVAVGVRSPEDIDQMNILEATKAAMADAVNTLDIRPDLLLVDAVRLDMPMAVRPIVHGDATCYAIAAASIVAKVYRDNLMQSYAAQFPGYGFEKNMGYGTAEHIEGLQRQGLTPIHRRSFVKNFV
ncbi:MAG: ribonuclease HII [Eubacterium sp.]|nr:ribonuclease HII [Eubacterium sp.]